MARLIKPPGLILPRGFRKQVRPALDPTHRLSRALVGYWHLGDFKQTGAIHDLITNNALTIANGPFLFTLQSHHGGEASYINNGVTNQNLTAPNGVQTYPFSMSGWFNHVSGTVVLGNISINASIWDGWYLSASTSAGWTLNSVSNTTFATGAIGANTRQFIWDHVVGVATSATSRTIYVNGVQGTVDTSSSTPARTDHQFRVGDSGVTGNSWEGGFDALRFYNRVLTAQDVLQLYAEPYAGLVQAPYRIIGPTTTNVNVTLTGQAMTAGQGAITCTASKALTGQAATTGQGSVTTAAAVYTGYTFRHSLAGGSGFPGDPANTTWADISVLYSGGTGVGFNFGPGGNASNFNSPVNGYYGGDWENNDSSAWWRVDVPKGPIDVRLLLGDTNTIRFRYGPGSTLGTDYSDISGASAGTYPKATDATGVVFTDASTWLSGNTPLRVTNIAGYLQVEKKPGVGFNSLAYLAYRVVPTALVDCTFTDETGAAGAPTLFQNQVSGKLVGTIQQSIGGSPATSLGVFESDGTTPSLYLQIQVINGVPWLAHKAVQMPALSGTYNFKIIQTDISGKAFYSNSPYVQSCAWTVTPASTKPYNDGTFLSKISAGAFLLRKKVTDFFAAPYDFTARTGEWMGYTSGTFDFSATVKTVAALKAQIITYQAAAKIATNKKYRILIDVDGTSDWSTHCISFNSADWTTGDNGLNMYPENGNLLYITYTAGLKAGPVLYGGWNMGAYVRGVHADGIIWGMDNSTTEVTHGWANGNANWAYGAITWNTLFPSSSGVLGVLRVTNCDIGLLFNPTYISGGGSTTQVGVDQSKIPIEAFAAGSNGSCMEQFVCTDCRFWGIGNSFTLFGNRSFKLKNIDVALCNDDTLAVECIRVEDTPTIFPTTDQYEWMDNVNLRYVCDSNPFSIHADFQQQRILDNGTHGAGQIYRLWENSTCNINCTDTAIERNVMIISDSPLNINGCWLNNILVSYALRGVDGGMGSGVSYAEYNSVAPSHTMPAGQSIQDQQVYNAYGAKLVLWKNIMGGGTFSLDFTHDHDVGYNTVQGGVDPNTVMFGPFGTDPGYPTRWAGPAVTDAVPTYNLTTYKGAMQLAFSPVAGVDAGFQGTLSLAGLAMTAGQGALARSVAIALSGQSMTSGQGTLARTVAKVLSGQAATSQIGAVALSASWAMPGQAMTAAPGAPALSVAKVLSGQTATSQTGAVALSVLLAISGQEASTGLGTVTGAGGDFVAAEGEEVMLVPLEDRMMFVPVEERTMAVTK